MIIASSTLSLHKSGPKSDSLMAGLVWLFPLCRSYTELPESDRYLDRDSYQYSKSSMELDKVADLKYDPKFMKNQKLKPNGAGYRHSYVEPKQQKCEKKGFNDILHRTNSSVSNSGRVGIASIHPYWCNFEKWDGASTNMYFVLLKNDIY